MGWDTLWGVGDWYGMVNDGKYKVLFDILDEQTYSIMIKNLV